MIFLTSTGTDIVPVPDGMDLFLKTMQKLWDELGTITVPIVKLPMTKFLLGVFALSVMVRVISIFIRGDSKDD